MSRPRLADQALSIPNLLTYGRILSIPVILVIMQEGSKASALVAAALFALASATDALDGWLARRLGQVSILGALLDPLADKLLVMGTLVMLVALDRVSPWLVVVLLAREMLITGLRAVAANEGLVIAAGRLGKVKTALQMVGIGGLLLHYDDHLPGGLSVPFHDLGLIALLLSLAFSLVSAGEYVRGFLRSAYGPPADEDSSDFGG